MIDTICGILLRHERGAGVAIAEHDVEHAGGEELGHQLGHPHRARRRRVGRLQHHRVAGGERRRPLPHGHHRRVVPGRHRRAHADRLAPDARRVAGHVLAGRGSLEHPCGAGEEPDLIDHRRHLFGQHERLGLAGVLALDRDQLLGPRLDRVGDLEQRELALGRGRLPPALERARRRLTRRVDLLLGGHGRLGEHLLGDRVDELQVAAVLAGHLTVDEVRQHFGHSLSFASSKDWVIIMPSGQRYSARPSAGK